MSFYRRDLPLTLTFVLGILYLFSFFFKVKEVDSMVTTISNWGVLVAAFSVCFGATTTILFQLRGVRKRVQAWYLNAWLVIVALAFIVIGTVLSPNHVIYKTIYNAVIPNGSVATSTLVGIATVSVVVRRFRTRSLEVTLITVPAMILIMMNTPVWDAMWTGFATIGTWLLVVPGTAGNRGFIIGAAIGALALALRTLIGKEAGYLGRD